MKPAQQWEREAALIDHIDTLRTELRDLRREIASVPPTIQIPSIARLVTAVAAEFDVSERAILSPQRAPSFVTARQVVMHLAVTSLRKSLPTIGRCLKRDHTTVMHGNRTIARRMAKEPDLAARVARVAAAIETPPEIRA